MKLAGNDDIFFPPEIVSDFIKSILVEIVSPKTVSLRGFSNSENPNPPTEIRKKGNNPDVFYYIYDFNGFVIVCIRLYGLSKIFELLWIFTDLVWRGKIKRSTFFSPY